MLTLRDDLAGANTLHELDLCSSTLRLVGFKTRNIGNTDDILTIRKINSVRRNDIITCFISKMYRQKFSNAVMTFRASSQH